MVTIVNDIDLSKDITKYDTLIVGVNAYCTMRNGFQREVSLDYPYVLEDNMKTNYGDISKMGTILESKKENEPTFIIAFICRGFPYRKKGEDIPDYLSYESLEKCLKLINVRYKGRTIATTMLGCSRFDGNGNKNKVIGMMNDIMTDVNLIVYDYYQEGRDEKRIRIYKEELEVKKSDYKKYHQMVKDRKEKAEKRFERNKRARY